MTPSPGTLALAEAIEAALNGTGDDQSRTEIDALAVSLAPRLAAALAERLAVPRQALRPQEAATALGVSTSLVYELMETGTLPFVRITDRLRVIRVDAIAAYLEGGEQRTPQAPRRRSS